MMMMMMMMMMIMMKESEARKVYTGSAQLPVPQLGRCALSSGRSLLEAGKVCIGHRRDRDVLAREAGSDLAPGSSGDVQNGMRVDDPQYALAQRCPSNMNAQTT